MSFDSPHRRFRECTSTNDIARIWLADLKAPAPHGALVSADFQTQGRGRRSRRWEASSGESALMSVILYPESPLRAAWHLGFLAALATADALTAFGAPMRLKWPNDVVAAHGKIAGVLIETVPLPEGRWAAIAGIGINVNQSEFPNQAEYRTPPTSLYRETGTSLEVDGVIDVVWKTLAHWYDAYAAQWDFALIRDAWQQRLALDAALNCDGKTGRLAGIDADGAARVLLPDGTFAVWSSLEE